MLDQQPRAWALPDYEAATAEGWGLFDVDSTGFFEIQRLDEHTPFDNDDAALNYVIAQGASGSEHASLALRWHMLSAFALLIHRKGE